MVGVLDRGSASAPPPLQRNPPVVGPDERVRDGSKARASFRGAGFVGRGIQGARARVGGTIEERRELSVCVGFRKTDRRDFRGRQPRSELVLVSCGGTRYFWVTKRNEEERKALEEL